MGLSYLFARAVDTIADSDLIDRTQRLRLLHLFREQFRRDLIEWGGIQAIQAALIPYQQESAERLLLQRLEDCFRVYLEFSTEDRRRIRELMEILPNGMEIDLTRFPGESAKEVCPVDSGRVGSVYLLCGWVCRGVLDEDDLRASACHGRLGCGEDVGSRSQVREGFTTHKHSQGSSARSSEGTLLYS
jgi:hypothetical protein